MTAKKDRIHYSKKDTDRDSIVVLTTNDTQLNVLTTIHEFPIKPTHESLIKLIYYMFKFQILSLL